MARPKGKALEVDREVDVESALDESFESGDEDKPGRQNSSKKSKGKAPVKPRKRKSSESTDDSGDEKGGAQRSPKKKLFKSKEYIEDSDAELEGVTLDIPPRRQAEIVENSEIKAMPKLAQAAAGPSNTGNKKKGAARTNGAGKPSASTEKAKADNKPAAKEGKPKKPKAEPVKKQSKKKEVPALSPAEEEIKKLKALVTACGVRKVWAREFDHLDTPVDKIARLRKLLSDLGMKGRFSLEQAKAIKTKREMAQELADVTSFADRHATSGRRSARPSAKEAERDDADGDGDDDVDDEPVVEPRRKKNAAQSIMAFLGDQSEDE